MLKAILVVAMAGGAIILASIAIKDQSLIEGMISIAILMASLAVMKS